MNKELFYHKNPNSGETSGPYHQSNYIHPTCIIYPGVAMGTGNYFGPYCIIGAPAEHKTAWDAQSVGQVIIGNNNTFTGANTIDSAVITDSCKTITGIGDNCMFLKRAHVGHNALVEDNCIISVNVVVGGHCIICQDVNLGVGAFIHQRQVIAPFCMIGAGAVVAKGLRTLPFITYAGVPAQALGDNNHWIAQLTKGERREVKHTFFIDEERYRIRANS